MFLLLLVSLLLMSTFLLTIFLGCWLIMLVYKFMLADEI
jgi:hypothetical protein